MTDLPHLTASLFNTPHLVRQGKFDAILNAVAPRILNGGKLPVLAFDQEDEAMLAVSGPRVIDGIGVVPVVGTLVRRGSWLDAMSGLTSYDALADQITDLALRRSVRAVLLDIDSHGGEAGGVFDLADLIRAIQEQTGKPIWAHANENAASAAYSIAAACRNVWIARTGEVGSIGVVAAHLDQSKADEKAGLAWTFLHAGKQKLDGNPHAPLPNDVAVRVQKDVDALYDMFVRQVAKHRRMAAAEVRATQAGVFRGAKAVRVGLADRVGTFEEALVALHWATMKKLPSQPSRRPGGGDD